jgi:hypothetical protein
MKKVSQSAGYMLQVQFPQLKLVSMLFTHSYTFANDNLNIIHMTLGNRGKKKVKNIHIIFSTVFPACTK